ncbi:2-oxoisovalerate dehydrogenase alpha subunit [Trypanosoma conorhini]|uniref:2-oxoisovalerate dehydrogenase subunit alpha n=1 Tax=Trypanosoma conorhini TaxID=83891 RepID=A0A422Q3D2_9TRYP|nr:2-oxoisovalerate dehydrogenase alpha subunit [Trypanosoma conorhini]RNF24469.1 2-oxoisovalerate dehydrogenase alpha subunit [Trypanosoma conorhini]
MRATPQAFMCAGGFSGTPRRLCPVLEAALSKAQTVWNLDFGGSPTTQKLTFHQNKYPSVPMFQVLNRDGSTDNPSAEPEVPKETLVKMLETMLRQHTIDTILMEAQRQGRISFYMTSHGEEASIVGTAAALCDGDDIFMQYREGAALSYRGYTISEMVAQCMGNIENELKGRQMPIHYGSQELHVHVVGSALATQIPHAAGAGYAFRLENLHEKDNTKKRIAATYFGEGAASEGDFHAGVNFAATMGSNTLFFVRNNGYAISTPTSSQYAGDGIFARGLAYGIPTARVDGHDVLAVYHTVREAREIICTTNQPVLVEALTYRASHHSSSDDSTSYRSQEETEEFTEVFAPIPRFENYMVKKGLWSPEQSQRLTQQVRKETLHELRRQEKLPHWPVSSMHDDVYKEMTPEMQKAQQELEDHYARNREAYKV